MPQVVLTTDRSYKAGQQLCTSYGQMDNAKRLFSFGFVTLTIMSNSPPDQPPAALPTEAYCDVVLPLQTADHLYPFKAHVLQTKFGKRKGTFQLSAVFRLSPGPPSVRELVDGQARLFVESSMPLLRLMALSNEDLKLGDLRGAADGFVCPPRAHAFEIHEEVAESTTREDRSLKLEATVEQDHATTELLRRLQRPVSDTNEERALDILTEECESALRKIKLCTQDVALLERVARQSKSRASSAVSGMQSRPVLSATVRVAESIAWLAILEAGCRVRRSPPKTWVSDSCSEEETINTWLVKLIEMMR